MVLNCYGPCILSHVNATSETGTTCPSRLPEFTPDFCGKLMVVWLTCLVCLCHSSVPLGTQLNWCNMWTLYKVHVVQSLVFCVVFCPPLFIYCRFSFLVMLFSRFWDRPVPIFSDLRLSYLVLVQGKKNHVRFTGKCMLYSSCQLKVVSRTGFDYQIVLASSGHFPCYIPQALVAWNYPPFLF